MHRSPLHIQHKPHYNKIVSSTVERVDIWRGRDRIDSALSRSGMSQRQIDTLVDAFNAGKVRTQLVVMKPKHLGAGVTKGWPIMNNWGRIQAYR